jgi:putative ABC transport system permease protein
VALQRVDAGFDPSSVLTVELVPRGARYDSPGKRRDFYHQLLERLEALPGVRSAAAAAELPLTNHGWTSDFSVAGRAPDQYGVEVAHREVTPGYFETMRVPVLRGREFTDADTAGATPVILINDALARRYFRGEDPLGQRMAFARAPTAESVWWTIVGIVGSERQDGLDVEPVIQVMQPFDQASGNPMTLVIRTSESPGALAAPVRALVADLDPDLPILGLRTMEEVWDASLDTPRFLLAMLATFAAVGLLLAMVGVYGVMAQFARGRRHEMGIRLALGASGGRCCSRCSPPIRSRSAPSRRCCSPREWRPSGCRRGASAARIRRRRCDRNDRGPEGPRYRCAFRRSGAGAPTAASCGRLPRCSRDQASSTKAAARYVYAATTST